MLDEEVGRRADGIVAERRALHAALGYEEVPAFDSGRHAEHWFAESLR